MTAADDETREIQRAIDAGGHVRLEPGTHVVRTLQLRTGLTLEIPKATTLLAHPENNAFDLQEKLPYDPHSDMETSDFAHGLLVGRNLDGVAIVGEGVIDLARTVRWGPKPIALRQCRDVRIEGITICRAPNYSVSLGACDGVVVQGVTIRDALSDGIDPDSCRRVRIADCIESDDDAICLKASLFLGSPRASEDIDIVRCRTRSGTNGFKIGTETSGSVRRVRVSDCDFDAGGISIQTVDGSDIEDVTVEHVRISHPRGPISVRRGARGRGQDTPHAGTLRDIVLRDIAVSDARETSWITGLPGLPVERVTLERFRVVALGGGKHSGEAVPESDAYPQNTMFGTLPAWGLYARHVDGLTMRDIDMRVDEADLREMIVLDDVRNVTE